MLIFETANHHLDIPFKCVVAPPSHHARRTCTYSVRTATAQAFTLHAVQENWSLFYGGASRLIQGGSPQFDSLCCE